MREVREFRDKHHRFFWQATDDSCFTIIGDSLVDKIRSLK